MLNRFHIEKAIEGSLKRLGIETIDLYQLHWTDRSTNFFGKRGSQHNDSFDGTPVEEATDIR